MSLASRRLRLLPARPRRGRDITPLTGTAHRVRTDDGALLHVEVDELDEDGGTRGAGAPDPGRAPGEELAPTVVLLHGYGLSADAWHFQRRALRGRYRLVLPEHRGHGRSGRGPAGPVTVERVADDLGQVLDAVVPEGPLVLVGHSLGGMTVMALAVRRPDLLERVRGVALVATSAGGLAGYDHGLPLLGRHLVRWAELLLARAAGRTALLERGRRVGADVEQRLVHHWSFASPVPPEVSRFAARMMAGTTVEVIADLLPAFSTLDLHGSLAALSGRPVLVVTADRDLMTPAEHGRRIADAVEGAEHVLVRRAGHLVMLEHPGIVTARLERLLARVAGRAVVPPARAARPAGPRAGEVRHAGHVPGGRGHVGHVGHVAGRPAGGPPGTGHVERGGPAPHEVVVPDVRAPGRHP
ncbi:alpha/beta fold hydrolase [Kineococcus terrestris]|uniref:alpha/beta fold hydrolase n=1 Tax=Kineococcus terrestris TaxID=2044856 RepID=UPI0034DB676E